MKIFFFFLLLVLSSNIFANVDKLNDYLQGSTQINSSIEYIDSYNKYTVINPNLKIKLVDFGNINKTKKEIKYTLKNMEFKFQTKRKCIIFLKVKFL